jgi:predicted oxidoreductase (fatty acid repression mutant protein)
MAKDFYNALRDRRTFYGIGKEMIVSEHRIEEVVREAVKYTPTAFNSQSARTVVLFQDAHNQLWEITKEILRKIVPGAQFSSTEEKLNSFQNGYGTVLFFEDDSVTQALQKQFPLYKDNFPLWAEQANGMLQLYVWTALEIEGLGLSLQHYNPLIDEEVKAKWNLPESWRLIGQMPFGNKMDAPGEKTFMPLEERLLIFH